MSDSTAGFKFPLAGAAITATGLMRRVTVRTSARHNPFIIRAETIHIDRLSLFFLLYAAATPGLIAGYASRAVVAANFSANCAYTFYMPAEAGRGEEKPVWKKRLAACLLLALALTLPTAAGAAGKDDALLAAVRHSDVTVAEKLLAGGAAVDTRDVWGKSPLIIAAARADVAMAQILLAHGAGIDARDNWQRTPLIVAVQAGSTWLTDILIHRGADVNLQAANGITALIAAAQRGNVAGAAMLIAAGVAVDHRDIMGWTPLMWAARRADREMILLLLDSGADANTVDRDGRTVIDQAAGSGYPPHLTELLRANGALPAGELPAAAYGETAPESRCAAEYRPAIAGSAVKGPPSAPVTIFEYTDFQCPYCRSAAEIVEDVLAKYRGSVKLVLKHCPMESHLMALPAARYFEALRRQDEGLAWRFYRRIFTGQDRLKEGESFLRQTASELGADLSGLDAALTSPAVDRQIAADIREADAYGLDGVPIFIVNGRLIDGAHPLETFAAVIDRLLAGGDRLP